MATATQSGLSFTIDDGGLLSHLAVAPNIVAYFAAKALGSMFAKARKTLIAKNPKKKNLIRRTLYYSSWPPGGKEQMVLAMRDVTVIGRIKTTWFTTSKITAIHEHGGVIRPVNKRALFIALGKAKAALGARRMANRLAALGPTQETFTIRTGKGAFVFARDKAHTGKPELVGMLKDSVTLKPTLGFYSNWASLEQDRAERIRKAEVNIAASLNSGRSIDAEANRLLQSAFKRERRQYEREAAPNSVGAL